MDVLSRSAYRAGNLRLTHIRFSESCDRVWKGISEDMKGDIHPLYRSVTRRNIIIVILASILPDYHFYWRWGACSIGNTSAALLLTLQLVGLGWWLPWVTPCWADCLRNNTRNNTGPYARMPIPRISMVYLWRQEWFLGYEANHI
jgi:hypothetical protein